MSQPARFCTSVWHEFNGVLAVKPLQPAHSFAKATAAGQFPHWLPGANLKSPVGSAFPMGLLAAYA
ncbi:MAG: hypothetical protein ABL886_12500 [Rhodoglobus sp.]